MFATRSKRLAPLLLLVALFASACASSGATRTTMELPQESVADPDFRSEMLQHDETKKLEEETTISFEEAYIVSDWKVVKRGETVLNQTRRVAFVGEAKADATVADTSIVGGKCYLFEANAFQHHLGEGKFRAESDLRFTTATGELRADRLHEVDCSELPGRRTIASGDAELDHSPGHLGRTGTGSKVCERNAYDCTSLNERTRTTVDTLD